MVHAPSNTDAFVPGVHAPAFRPSLWCRGAHAQTIWPFAFRRQAEPVYRRERVELDDGDFIDLDWSDDKGPVVLLLHGLEGCSRSHYIMGQVRALQAGGYRAVVMHFRGCSGVPNRLARSYHAGDTADIDAVVKHITITQPVFATVGYSLGGNAMLKWLGEQRDRAPVDTAVAISVPYDLGFAADAMTRGISRIYQRRLLGLLHRKTRARFADTAGPLDLDRLDEWRDFRSFDNNVTAPLHGFDDVDDYYRKSSSRQFLRGITRPVLLLHAADDPFMTPDTAPNAADLSATIRLELAPSGGHVGFVSGRVRPVYWLDQRVVRHLNQMRLQGAG